jgi:hypothetical protein
MSNIKIESVIIFINYFFVENKKKSNTKIIKYNKKKVETFLFGIV